MPNGSNYERELVEILRGMGNFAGRHGGSRGFDIYCYSPLYRDFCYIEVKSTHKKSFNPKSHKLSAVQYQKAYELNNHGFEDVSALFALRWKFQGADPKWEIFTPNKADSFPMKYGSGLSPEEVFNSVH